MMVTSQVTVLQKTMKRIYFMFSFVVEKAYILFLGYLFLVNKLARIVEVSILPQMY
jgi:hypothetical protein